jgi:flagellar M-ring protein FliF
VSEYLKKVFAEVSDFYKGLSPGRRIAVVVTGAGILAGIMGMFLWAGEKTFHPLMTNLSPEDSANVMRVLRDKRIPFRVDETGRSITVPPEMVDQLRLELAANNVIQSSTVGYEVFDKQSLGVTSFVQKINQKRALEGELTRTIQTIHGVRRSRVHLALPQKSAFVEDQRKPSASVVVDVENGILLTDKQINGMQNLVARAVEGMDVENVVIVDAMGKQLSRSIQDTMAMANATQLEFKQKMERDSERRIEEMLARVVGDGKVVARVSADLDFSQTAETQTVYDSDGAAVRSVQRDQKSMEGSRPGAQGPAGAASNLPGQQQQVAQGTKSDTKTSSETTNYEVPQTVRKTTRPSGQVRRLSVAVLMDGKQVRVAGKDGAADKTEVQSWSPEKLAEFEAIVIQAAGIDRKRGDTLEIKNIEFTKEDFEEAQRMANEAARKSYIRSLTVYVVVGMLILLFFILVVRPFIKWITDNTVHSVETYLPQTIEELEKLNKASVLPGLEAAMPEIADKIDPEKVEGEMIKEKVISLVESNPHKAALILRDWLHADLAKKKDDKAPAAGGKGK